MTRSIKTLSVALLLSAAVFALPGNPAIAENSEQLVLGVDKAKLYRLEKPASTIIIGNPTIADVTIQDGNLLVFTGKNFGVTNIIILDENDKEMAHFDVNVSSTKIGSMTVYKGSSKSSYNCTPTCEQSLSVGDDPKNFSQLSRQIENKMKINKGEATPPRNQ